MICKISAVKKQIYVFLFGMKRSLTMTSNSWKPVKKLLPVYQDTCFWHALFYPPHKKREKIVVTISILYWLGACMGACICQGRRQFLFNHEKVWLKNSRQNVKCRLIFEPYLSNYKNIFRMSVYFLLIDQLILSQCYNKPLIISN